MPLHIIVEQTFESDCQFTTKTQAKRSVFDDCTQIEMKINKFSEKSRKSKKLTSNFVVLLSCKFDLMMCLFCFLFLLCAMLNRNLKTLFFALKLSGE